ncbi:MAG: biotin transporter BioY [Vagococcus sp.]
MRPFTTHQMTRIGLFTAVIVALSQLSIPMPYGVPMTLQTFIIPLIGVLLGKKEGTMATTIYIILGMIGLPVFAGFSGGFGIVLGPTGGFILSFPFIAYFAGLGAEKGGKLSLYAGLSIGAVINYLVGMVFFSLVTSNTLTVAFTACVLPFIPTAIIKIILVGLIGEKLKRVMSSKRLVSR